MRLLWVAPSRREAAWLPSPAVVAAGQSGGTALERHLRAAEFDAVVIAGLCGGLDPSLGPGDLILSRSVSYADDHLESTTPIHAISRLTLRSTGLNFASGTILSTDQPIAGRDEKVAIWNRTGAAGVDMESHHLARVVDAAQMPWLVLRVIVDPASLTLPESVRDWIGEEDEREIAHRLLRRPRDWPAAARLGLGLRKAGRALRQASQSIDRALGMTSAEILEGP